MSVHNSPGRKIRGYNCMKAPEIDKKFDAGEDISQYFDTAKARALSRNSNGLMLIFLYG